MSESRQPTPGQTIGPFFHTALPYPRDHQLVAPGTPGAIRLHGCVYDGHGSPVPDALVEIRQSAPDGQVPAVEGSLARDDGAFTGWGRSRTDGGGRYRFLTLAPGAPDQGAAFFAMTIFARGLLDRLFTRAYLPGEAIARDPFLTGLSAVQRATLVATPDEPAEEGNVSFDIHLQGERETAFLRFPAH